jgi:membrane protein required for colicin V production
MTWVDWTIAIVLLASVLTGLFQGFFRTACSLIGLLAGLSLAARYYGGIATALQPLVRIEAIADAIGFFTIALLVMALANLVGNLLGKAFDWMGLGCLDMLGGGILGFFQGVVFVTLCIMIAVAFFPTADWLKDSRLPRQFYGALRLGTRVTPDEMTERIRQGFRKMEMEGKELTNPNGAVPNGAP